MNVLWFIVFSLAIIPLHVLYAGLLIIEGSCWSMERLSAHLRRGLGVAIRKVEVAREPLLAGEEEEG